MENARSQSNNKKRFIKLSLKKNRLKLDEIQDSKKLNRSSDVIIIDESFDRLRPDFPRHFLSSPKLYSPILINDSDEISTKDLSDDMHKMDISNEKEPSRKGNVSFNCSKENLSIMDTGKSRPNVTETWSPAQNIICATPRHLTVPSTPKDEANESLEQCSLKKIQDSQKKLLNDLYGEQWKSIPTLFKTKTHKKQFMDAITKKLKFFDDEESDKENALGSLRKEKQHVKDSLKKNKEMYLTESDTRTASNLNNTEKKSKKKLYTEKIPSTPDVPKQKLPRPKNATTAKKTKAMSVTELVNTMKDDKKEIDVLTKKVEKIKVTTSTETVNRLSFIGSLADNVPSWRCHVEAIQYVDSYKTLRDQLSRRLYAEFNKCVFDNTMDADLPILWDTKLRSTAGTTTNRLIKTSSGQRVRTSSIKLSSKVVDAPQRLRDTLIHELCHAATWLIDGELRAGHGPLWKKWATRALKVFPELGEISRCHDLEIHFKYSYKCTKCGYSIQRHSKSIDVTKKCCGYCRGTFEVIVNKKTKDGVTVSTPARKGGPNDFALYVKENYAATKAGRTHAQVMKLLGEQYSSAKKNKISSPIALD